MQINKLLNKIDKLQRKADQDYKDMGKKFMNKKDGGDLIGSPNDISTGSGKSKIRIMPVDPAPSLRIRNYEGNELLRIEPNGKIIWCLNGKEIIVKEKSLLSIALLDVVAQMTNMKYDYSKIDPELWKGYQEFLKTKHE